MKRLEYKIDLVKLIYQLGSQFEEERLRKLSIFLDELLSLPREAEDQFITFIDQYIQKEDQKTMGLSWERTPSARVFRNQGLREGIEKGKLEGKLEDAKNMITKGLSIDLIIEITGLSREKIETLNTDANDQ